MKKELSIIMLYLMSNLVSCKFNQDDKKDLKDLVFPSPTINQALVVHPYSKIKHDVWGYTLFTDVDRDGSWDAAEIHKHNGALKNIYGEKVDSTKLFYKKGFGPAQYVDVPINYIKNDFFKVVQ
ncbi:hypothetical protein K9L97_03885 [Candidatus Woesearchaeota archaeon]|nr:hypothetical protein [Candidatus Woesearchaeota archaeon]